MKRKFDHVCRDRKGIIKFPEVAGTCEICYEQRKKPRSYRPTLWRGKPVLPDEFRSKSNAHGGHPWTLTFHGIKARCERPNNAGWKQYGGRGIKCLITKEELRYLWFRDKAYLMKRPSIHRIDNDGNYQLSNCRYVELDENLRERAKLITHCPKGHPYAGKNLRIDNKAKGYRRCRKCRNEQYLKWWHNASYREYCLERRRKAAANAKRSKDCPCEGLCHKDGVKCSLDCLGHDWIVPRWYLLGIQRNRMRNARIAANRLIAAHKARKL